MSHPGSPTIRSVRSRLLVVVAVAATLLATVLPAASWGMLPGPRPVAGSAAAHPPTAKRKRHRRKRVCHFVRKRVHHRTVRRKVCKPARPRRKAPPAPPDGSGTGRTGGPGGGGTTGAAGGGNGGPGGCLGGAAAKDRGR
jgi:hypothetical protein